MSNEDKKDDNDDRRRRPILVELYERYLADQGLAGFIRGITKWYSSGTLERLSCHGDSEIRCAAVASLGFVGQFDVNHAMGRAMMDDNQSVRRLAQSGIRSVWNRVGTGTQRQQLANVIRLNAVGKHREAHRLASDLIDQLPIFAEAWYQRGAAWFGMKKYAKAIGDCHQALEINPYHFVAAAMMGDGHLELENLIAALDAYRRAQRVNPDMERVNVRVEQLARRIDER